MAIDLLEILYDSPLLAERCKAERPRRVPACLTARGGCLLAAALAEARRFFCSALFSGEAARAPRAAAPAACAMAAGLGYTKIGPACLTIPS